RIQNPTPSAKGAYGSFRWNATVWSSRTSMSSTQVSLAATLPSWYSMIESAVNFTSSAVTGVPSDHSKPSSRWKTTVLPPSSVVTSSASSGTFSALPSIRSSDGYIALWIQLSVLDSDCSGLKFSTSVVVPIRIVVAPEPSPDAFPVSPASPSPSFSEHPVATSRPTTMVVQAERTRLLVVFTRPP